MTNWLNYWLNPSCGYLPHVRFVSNRLFLTLPYTISSTLIENLCNSVNLWASLKYLVGQPFYIMSPIHPHSWAAASTLMDSDATGPATPSLGLSWALKDSGSRYAPYNYIMSGIPIGCTIGLWNLFISFSFPLYHISHLL